MTTPGDADDGRDVRKFVDQELSKMRFVTESSDAVAEWVTEAIQAEVDVIVKARLGGSSRQVTAGSARIDRAERRKGGDSAGTTQRNPTGSGRENRTNSKER